MTDNTPPCALPRKFTVFCLRCRRLNLHNCNLLRIIAEEIRTGTPLSPRTRFCNNCRDDRCGECTTNAADAQNRLPIFTPDTWAASAPSPTEEHPFRNAAQIQRLANGRPALPSLFPAEDEFPNWPNQTPLDLNATQTQHGRPAQRLPHRGRGGSGRNRGGNQNYRGGYDNRNHYGGHDYRNEGYGFGGTYPPYYPHITPPGLFTGHSPYVFGGYQGNQQGPVPLSHAFNPNMPTVPDPREVQRLHDQIAQLQSQVNGSRTNGSREMAAKRNRIENSKDTFVGQQALLRANSVDTTTDHIAVDVRDVAGVRAQSKQATNALKYMTDESSETQAQIKSLRTLVTDVQDELDRIKVEQMTDAQGHVALDPYANDGYTQVTHGPMGRGRGRGRGRGGRGSGGRGSGGRRGEGGQNRMQ